MQEVQTSLPVGTLLRERYLIKSVLGAGIAGTVYLAKDQQAKNIKYQLFALKEISGLDQQARYQFTFNGTALRQLQHPALPHIHHIFNDDKRGCIYLVMDYVEGTSLETLRQRQPSQRLRWSELRTICEPLAAALTYLHLQEKPLFHGDLAPTNAIQGIAGKVMFLDLGYAQAATTERSKLIASATSTSYHAPEQLTGELDAFSDVYGLAAMLYELVTGQAPVDALTRLERVNKKKADPLMLASKVTPDVHRPLAETLQKALALDPAERFPSVKAFWQALNALPIIDQDATPVASKQRTPGTVAVNPVPTPIGSTSNANSAKNGKRRIATLPAVAVLCALFLLVAGLGTWAWASAHNSANPRSGTIHNQQGSPIANGPTPISAPGKYTNLLGTYQGNLHFLSGAPTTFTLHITSQVQSQFRGDFISPLASMQSGTVIGTIDTARNPDIAMKFFDNSKNVVMSLSGALNGITGSQINTTDSVSGSFSTCEPNQGTQCTSPGGPDNTGNWSIGFVSSAFIAPTSAWS